MRNTNQIQQNPPKNHQNNENSSNFTCELCIEPVTSPNTKFNNDNKCMHSFCTDCVIKYIQVKLDDNVSVIKCPALSCVHCFDPFFCRSKIGERLFDQWCDVLLQSALSSFDRVYCPNRICSALVVDECGDGDSLERCICPNCKKPFCYRCKIPWHAGYRCEESRETKDANDIAFGALSERNKWMRCPACRHCVELVEGCTIILCRCGIEFCYECGKKVDRLWCNCQGASTFWMFIFHICLIVFILGALFSLATAISRRNNH